MSVQHNTRPTPVNIFQAAQEAVGVSVPSAMKWIGAFIASTWFWTAAREGNSVNPIETPLEWLQNTAYSFGWGIQWPVSVQDWLLNHPGMFWVLLAVAAFAVGHERKTGHTTGVTFGLVAVLLAMSVHGVVPTVLLYAAITLAIASAAYLVDFNAEHSDPRREKMSSTSWTFGQWLEGPVFTLLLMPFGPAILVIVAVQHYRFPQGWTDLDSRAFQLGHDADELPKTALSEVPANVALRFLAEALLYAGTADDRKAAISALRRRGPTGAKRINLSPKHMP